MPNLNDGRRITMIDPAALTVEDIRHMTSWCDNQHEDWWRPEAGDLSLAQLLALYHAANDAGYAGMDEWASDEPDAAGAAWRAIRGMV